MYNSHNVFTYIFSLHLGNTFNKILFGQIVLKRMSKFMMALIALMKEYLDELLLATWLPHESTGEILWMAVTRIVLVARCYPCTCTLGKNRFLKSVSGAKPIWFLKEPVSKHFLKEPFLKNHFLLHRYLCSIDVNILCKAINVFIHLSGK